MKKLYFLLFVIASLFVKTTAQEWAVPEDKKAKGSPFQFTDETAKKGESVFQQN